MTNKTEEKRLDIMIAQNKIHIFDDGFSDDDLKDSKISEGYDVEYGNVKIVDKDYGKSAMLMQNIMEEIGGKKSNFSIPTVPFIIGGLILSVGAGFLIFGGDDEKVVIPQNQNIVEVVEKPVEELSQSIIPEFNQTQVINNESDLNMEIRQMAYNLNICQSESTRVKRSTDENYSSLLAEKSKLSILIKELESENIILAEKLKKYSGDEFFYDLGAEMFKRCENAIEEKMLDNCEKLVFNYIKNASIN